jgi:WD40 repeat protein
MRRKVFLSYARADDEAFARRLFDALEREGFDTWFDRERMPNRGLSFTKEIRDEIDRCERMILIAGPAAFSSAYVRAEWEHALLFGRSVVTVLRLGKIEDVPEESSRVDVPDFLDPRPFEEAFTYLLRQLQDEPAAWGPLLTPVPTLPLPYVPREGELNLLLGRVMPDLSGPAVVSGSQQTAAIVGLPGSGKSVLASAFARLARVRRAFQDGIAWLRLGQTRSVLEIMHELLLACDVQAPRDATWNEVRPALSKTLRDRKTLIVVDDVWSGKELETLRNALGRFCRLVITTRIGSAAESLQAQLASLELLSESEALDFLAAWAGHNAPRPGYARDLVRECGRLRLALAVCGAKLNRGTLPEDLLAQLADAKIGFLAASLPNYEYSDAYKAIHASLAALERDQDEARQLQAALYLSMAVFSKDESLPEAVVTLWWRSRSGRTAAEVREFLMDMADQRLLGLDGRPPNRTVTLHDLQFDYIHARHRAQHGSFSGLHGELVEAYRAASGGVWSRGPEDGYFVFHLGYHLVEANRGEELGALLHTFPWLSRATDAGASRLLADFDRLQPSRSLAVERRTIYQSAPALARDPSQLAGQLLGRIGDSEDPELQSLLGAARQWRGRPWLRPLKASLIKPDSPLSLVLSGHEGTVRTLACSPDGRILVTASNSNPDQTIRVWSLDSGIEMHHLEREAPAPTTEPYCTPLAFAADNERFFSAVGNEIRVWDWRTGRLERTLTGHQTTIVAMAASRRAPYVASVDQDGSLRVWQTEDWDTLMEIKTDAQPFFALALSPDGMKMACAGSELLQIFDASDWRIKRVAEPTGFDAHWGLQPPLCFHDGSQVLFWGRPLRYYDFARDGYSLVDATSTEALIDKAVDVDIKGDFVLDIFPSFPRLVFMDRERSVSYLVAYMDDERPAPPSRAAITPDNRAAIICGYDHRIEVWNLRQLMGARLVSATGCQDFIFSADSRYVLTRSGERYRLLRCEDGEIVDEPELLSALRAESEQLRPPTVDEEVGFASLVRGPEGALTTARPRGKYAEEPEPDDSRGWPVQFHPSGADGRNVVLEGHYLPVYAGAFLPGGTSAATAGQGRVIRIWDLATGATRFRLRGHTGTILALAVSADPQRPWLLSCSDDCTARVWDYRRGALVATYTADRPLRRAGMSPDGRTFGAGQGSAGPLHLLRLEGV